MPSDALEEALTDEEVKSEQKVTLNGDATSKSELPDGDAVVLGDKRVEISSFDRYKGRKDYTDRVALIWPTLTRAYVYFHNKRLIRAPKEPDLLALMRKHLGEPQQRFGVPIFRYATAQDGSLLEPAKCQGKVMLWGITERRFEDLTKINQAWPLLDSGFDEKQLDLSITCKEENFQNFTMQPLPEAHWKKKENWYKAIVARAKLAQDKMSIVLGRHLTRDEILQTLGAGPMSPPTGGTENAADIDLSDVIDE